MTWHEHLEIWGTGARRPPPPLWRLPGPVAGLTWLTLGPILRQRSSSRTSVTACAHALDSTSGSYPASRCAASAGRELAKLCSSPSPSAHRAVLPLDGYWLSWVRTRTYGARNAVVHQWARSLPPRRELYWSNLTLSALCPSSRLRPVWVRQEHAAQRAGGALAQRRCALLSFESVLSVSCRAQDRLPALKGAALGGRLRTAPLGPVAFVAQELAFFSNLTVRWPPPQRSSHPLPALTPLLAQVEETLTLAAKLRRGRQTGGASTCTDVSCALRRLGLRDVAATLVGGSSGGHTVPGVSGGERRRLAIGCETVGARASTGRARVVFADEPTSGLDSFHADRVVDALCALAHVDGACVIAVLHQPRSASFAKLDDLLLLAHGGRVVFSGPAQAALLWFLEMGHACPAHHNPAEWLVDLISVDDTSAEAETLSRARVNALVRAWRASQRDVSRTAPSGAQKEGEGELAVRPLGLWATFKLLLGRAATCALRDLWVNGTRAVASLVLGLAFGGLNYRLGRAQKSVQRRAALLMQCCINTAFLSMVKSLNSFPAEREVIKREVARGNRGGGGYSILPYFLSKLLVEAPLDALFPLAFGAVAARLAGLNPRRRTQLLATLALQGAAASALGLSVSALSPTTEASLALGPCIMVLSIMLADSGGVFSEVPPAITPLANLSIVKWGFEGAMGCEFPGLTFDVEGPLSVRKGEQVLAKMGLIEAGGVARAARAQVRAVCINLGVTLAALMARGGGGNTQRWEADLRAPESDFVIDQN